jgi:hypothetical protein
LRCEKISDDQMQTLGPDEDVIFDGDAAHFFGVFFEMRDMTARIPISELSPIETSQGNDVQ